jgi:hypothetical protein
MLSLVPAMIIVALLHAMAQAGPKSSQPPAPAPAPTFIAKNIVTDFRAKCNGVANDSPAFRSFNSWARRQTLPITLTIPSGSVCNLSSTTIAQGIKNLVVSGYGATLITGWLGGHGVIEQRNNNSRVATVMSGATSVTLLNPRQSSLFRVGSWAVLAGLDTQGEGYPPNQVFFEYVKITAINAATGQITFSNPIVNSYKSTWPHYPPPTADDDDGGSATLFALHPSWDMSVAYEGVTINLGSSQAYAVGRSVTFTDVTFNCSGTGGLAPTQNLNITLNNVTQRCQMEVDKLVDNFTINGGNFDQLFFQSSSGSNVFTMNNATVATMNGTPQKAIILDSRIGAFYVGTLHFGRTTEISCNNCNIGAFVYPPGGSRDNNVTKKYTMTGGVIASPNSNGPVAWAVPGANIMFARYDGNLWTEGVPFQVIDVTQDASNTYIQTSLGGGFPSLPMHSTGGLSIYGHPAPKFTCTNCTGGADAIDLAQAPAGAPIFSYSKRTFTGNQLPVWTGQTLSYARIWGTIVSVKINVTKPYTGTQPTLTLNALGPYGIAAISPDGSQTGLSAAINLKIAGERDIFPSSVIGTQSGDIISVPGPMWFQLGYSPTVSADISGESPSVWPTVTIEIITNQGVVSP